MIKVKNLFTNIVLSFSIFLLVNCSNNSATYDLGIKFKNYKDPTIYYVDIYSDKIIKNKRKTEKISYKLSQKIKSIYTDNSAKLLFTIDSIVKNDSIFKQQYHKYIIKITPFGEITYMNFENLPENTLDLDIKLNKLLIKLYPMLPYKKVKIGESWERKQSFYYEDETSFGNIDLYKKFKLKKVKDTIAVISFKIKGNSIINIKNHPKKAKLKISSKGEIRFNIKQKIILSIHGTLKTIKNNQITTEEVNIILKN